VLAGTGFHLQSSPQVLGRLRDGTVRIAFDREGEIEHLYALPARYAGCHPDLAEVCLIRTSESYPPYQVVTAEGEDFRVCRRNKREAIPVLCPPKR